ncbi:Glu-tRNA(Gln) amidotransferase subunit GatD [Candidatus Nitrososphaera sp. FF02]|uniref:Glu-tRNA(Gln) amidotransferase subunit GatD n=1 Tax=Candidatus Nitrososphaera sp. FF02 TaxID=3398226 RepID=UPI0039EB69F5
MSGGGYRGAGLDLISRSGVSVGDSVSIKTADGEMSGVLMPRYESASEDYIVIKLKSGYNTGVKVSSIESIKKIADAKAPQAARQEPQKHDGRLPKIALISTGGTIASKIDYRTGGVKAALSAEELYASVPELAGIASVDPEVLMSEYSENLKPEHWTAMADRIAEKVKTGRYAGIIVSHGTDTMHYTSSALSFALQGLPVPVVLVGAQRSSDRPSSDAALNLIGATIFAASASVAGVFVAMHAGTSDDAVAVHVGTRVRKNHTSRRDAFESIDVTPVALIKNGKIEMQESGIELAPRGKGHFVAKTKFDSKVMLLKYHPGFDPAVIDHAVSAGCRAIILEGTGLGHVNRDCFASVKKAVKKGVAVCMASQCIWGRVRMTVYDTGRDLLDLGVVPLSDMVSECATAKAMWALANSKDPAKAMQENLAGEMSSAIPIE